ncbi:MAG TPA: hypothetical protein VGQ42_03045 [Candidatus Dormibacteraeota bacterium]|jgi:hypothetical protein|nr:hypothetical protein [Candidatus Dormibacteraeota bacterium]
MDEQDEAIPWHAPGLLWRVQEHRRMRVAKRKRKERVPLRQRLRERGLHWSTEIVVGVFVAVGIAAFMTVLLARSDTGLSGDAAAHASGGGVSPVVQMTPTPALCYVSAAPRPCR